MRKKGLAYPETYSTTLMTEPEPSMLAAMASQSGPRKNVDDARTGRGQRAGTGSSRQVGSALTTKICPPAIRCQTPLVRVTGSPSNMTHLPKGMTVWYALSAAIEQRPDRKGKEAATA